MPVPREQLPDEMRSVLESVRRDQYSPHSTARYPDSDFQFISSQRPSLADIRSANPDAQLASTSASSPNQDSPTRGYERCNHEGRGDHRAYCPNTKWPFDFTFKGKKIPSEVYHTHVVAPRSRPDAKKHLMKRKWDPTRRHGRIILQENFDVGTARGLDHATGLLNSKNLDGRVAEGKPKKPVGRDRLWSWKGKLGRVMRIFRRG